MPSHRSCKSWRGAAATRRLVTGLVALVVGAGAQAAEQCSARSGPAVVPVVELYTAEGCSSCPPADQWLSHLQADPSIIALAFHVDYWDRDGWKDGFAKHAFTERQTVLQKSDGARFIYTPQVLVDGLDRPEWSVSAAPAMESRAAPVTIELSRHGSHVDATVSAATPAPPHRLAAYWAVTENGIVSEIKAGENRGATLHHDFLVRDYKPIRSWTATAGGTQTFSLDAGAPTAAGHHRDVNFVVVDAVTARPVQALKLGC